MLSFWFKGQMPLPEAVALTLVLLLRLCRQTPPIGHPVLQELWKAHWSFVDDHCGTFCRFGGGNLDEDWVIRTTLRSEARFWSQVVRALPALWHSWTTYLQHNVLVEPLASSAFYLANRLCFASKQRSVSPGSVYDSLDQIAACMLPSVEASSPKTPDRVPEGVRTPKRSFTPETQSENVTCLYDQHPRR